MEISTSNDISEFSKALFVLTVIVIMIYWRNLKTIKSDYEIYGHMPKVGFYIVFLVI
jgi:hypothetical protein